MPIYMTHNKDTILVEFGIGDIGVSLLEEEPTKLVLIQLEKKYEIGPIDTYEGKIIDELPGIPIILDFKKKESLDLVINKLMRIRDRAYSTIITEAN